MKVVWTGPALKDREQIVFFILQDNAAAAVAMDELFSRAAGSLERAPKKGRVGRIKNTRELVIHARYILVYGIDIENDILYITALLHTSRRWPPA